MATKDPGREAAVAVIEAAIASLREKPNQFSVSVNLAGFVAQNSGGTGFQANPTVSGGSVESITGFRSDMGSNQINIAQNAVSDQATKQSEETVRLLEQIRDAVQKKDGGKVKEYLAILRSKAIDLVYKVAEVAALQALHLPK